MSQEVRKENYDIVSISRPGMEKRANYVKDATQLETSQRGITTGKFVKVFSDIFLKHEANRKSYI